MNIRDMTPVAARLQALAVVQQLSHAEVMLPYEAERIAKNGRQVRVSMIATALVDESGAAYAIATTERATA